MYGHTHSGINKIASEGGVSLAKLTKLTKLDITFNPIGSVGANKLSSLPKLFRFGFRFGTSLIIQRTKLM